MTQRFAPLADRVSTTDSRSQAVIVLESCPVMELRAAQLKAGDRIGRYRIERLLGAGASGVVFLAHDTDLEVLVALKIIEEDSLQNPRSLERFRRELVLARRLTHPGICRVFDFFREENLRVISMEYIEGPTLASVLEREGSLSVERAVLIVRTLCRAARAAHRIEILHRDLKPHNIILGPGERPVILDFGMATAQDRDRVTRPGAAIGTPNYMAPEVCRGKGAAKGSDVYSLGVILYRSLTGRLPFTGDSPIAMRKAHEGGRPHPPTAFNSSISRALSEVVMHAIEIDPRLRMPTAEVFERRLSDAVVLPEVEEESTDHSLDAEVDKTVVREMGDNTGQGQEASQQEPVIPANFAGSNEWSADTDEGTNLLEPVVSVGRDQLPRTERVPVLGNDIDETQVTEKGVGLRSRLSTETVLISEPIFPPIFPPAKKSHRPLWLGIILLAVLSAGGIVAAHRWLPADWRSPGVATQGSTQTGGADPSPSAPGAMRVPPPDEDSATREHLAAADALRQNKALLKGDIPGFDGTRRAIDEHLMAQRYDEAERIARGLVSQLDAIEINRTFIEGKLRRLNRRYDRLPTRRKRSVDPVLNDAMQLFARDNLARVNRRLNDAFGLIAAPSP